MYKVTVKIEVSIFSIFIGWRQRTENGDWPKSKTAYVMGPEKGRKPLMSWDRGSKPTNCGTGRRCTRL